MVFLVEEFFQIVIYTFLFLHLFLLSPPQGLLLFSSFFHVFFHVFYLFHKRLNARAELYAFPNFSDSAESRSPVLIFSTNCLTYLTLAGVNDTNIKLLSDAVTVISGAVTDSGTGISRPSLSKTICG